MKRKSAVILAALTLVAGAGIAVGAVGPPGVNGPGLAAVGPVSPKDGFPVWYQDKTGLRVESCGIWTADPMCPAVAPLPTPGSPVAFPTNFPVEGFYQLSSALLNTAGAGKATIELNLEQSLPQPANGQQTTFSRQRFTITNTTDGVPYTITTPAGVKTVQSVGGKVRDTEDIGVAAGNFSGALGGHVGPFLTWDTFGNAIPDPALKPNAIGKPTYIGDGITPHKIIGSPYGTNFVRIQATGVNPTPLTDACPTVAGPLADCIETNLFVLQGKIATTSGVTADRATYSRSSAGAGLVDVFASSLPQSQQALQVSDVPVAPATAEFAPTALTGSVTSAGHYFARVPYVGVRPPTTVKVSNMGDVPVSSANIPVVDQVTGTAVFTTGTPGNPAAVPPAAAIPGSLAINAVSSDTLAPTPVLTASGFAALPVPLVAGALTVPLLDAPPAFVTVTSAKGGAVQLPVTVTGAAYAPVPAVAMAGPNQNAAVGALVTLDGSASTGALTYSWTSPAGIVLTNPTTVSPTFTPTAANIGAKVFTLTVTGTGGTTSSATVTVTVTAAAAAVANAGPNQLGIQRGTTVTLDGSLSSVGTYQWTQVVAPGDPVATLTGATTLKPTFTFPLYKSPANKGPLTFNLKVTSVNGTTANSTVTISPSSDAVVITRAVYTTNKATWLVAGTASILSGQTVTVHLGLITGPVIGTAIVDPTGAFQVRGTTPAAIAGSQVTAESGLGGVSASFPVKVQ
jgi:hypothetical protein